MTIPVAQAGPPAHEVSGGPSRLVDYLKARLVSVPVTEIGDLVTGGRVVLEKGGASRTGRTEDLVDDGDHIAVDPAALAALRRSGRWIPPWAQALAILHEDDDVLVVDKPAPLHVHPLGDRRSHTLVNALVHHAGARDDAAWAAWRPHVVQRLDCVVSGVMAVAKNARAKAALVRAQQRRAVHRTYLAAVHGTPREDEGTVDAPLGREPGRGWRRAVVGEESGGQPARTHWRVVERTDGRSILELRPETGRTHQLRVHLALLGHPIVGDDLYGSADPDAAPPPRIEAWSARAIALHSARLELGHPCDGRPLAFVAPPPPGFPGGGPAGRIAASRPEA